MGYKFLFVLSYIANDKNDLDLDNCITSKTYIIHINITE